MNTPKLKKADVIKLYEERKAIDAFLNPPAPDPNQWPPAGYTVHPENPEYLYRVVSAEELRIEMFGHPLQDQWEREAVARLDEINEALRSYFFPKAKEEGTERKQKVGFAAMHKGEIDRKFDMEALDDVRQRIADLAAEMGLADFDIDSTAIQWKPSLSLTEYRELPKKIRELLDQALIVTPKKAKFEIVALDESDEEEEEA